MRTTEFPGRRPRTTCRAARSGSKRADIGESSPGCCRLYERSQETLKTWASSIKKRSRLLDGSRIDVQAIPDARLGQQIARRAWIRLDLAPQVPHVDVQVVAFVGEFRPPDALEQHAM